MRALLGSLYNNIKPPSWLGPNTDFHLFKEGVEPKWEDPTCEHGGKWTVLIPRSPNNKQTLDTYWLNAVWTRCGPDPPGVQQCSVLTPSSPSAAQRQGSSCAGPWLVVVCVSEVALGVTLLCLTLAWSTCVLCPGLARG